MAFFHKKMLEVIVKSNPLEKPPFVPEKPPFVPDISYDCPDDDHCVESFPNDDLPPPPPPIPIVTSEKYHMPFYFILMLCVLGAVFVFICYMVILKRKRSNSRNRRNLSQLDENRDDFVIDENHGPVMDHPIWYIRTIGLSQDVIDSISVFKYKKDEPLIEGTDCSVCLTEFEEDESLRLLPKCSHAFHIPCIDTWLRSHKNCPLCRAPIVSNMDNIPQLSNFVEVVSITNIGDDSSPNEVNQLENNGRHNVDQLENLELDEEGNDETRRGVENLDALSNEEERTMDLSMKIPRVLDGRKKGVRVFSDLAEHRVKVINNELQPARRSVSMDSSAAQEIHLAMNEMNSGTIEGCSRSKRGDRNSSLYKSMKSSSFGRSLQKVPISMKRSFSTSGKCSLPTTSKIQDLRQTM